LPADHAAEVFLGDFKLEDGGVLALALRDVDGGGIIDQRFS
jgi:hypothetical protein